MKELLKTTFGDFFEDQGTRLAAALSYYTIFSLPPLLILILLILGTVMDPAEVQHLLTEQLGGLFGPGATAEIQEIFRNADRPDFAKGPMAAAGVGALLFGAVGAFVELQNALNRIWEVQPDPEKGGVKNFLMRRLFSFGIVLTLAFLLLVALVVSTALAAAGGFIERFLPEILSGAFLWALNAAVSLTVIALLFALMFRFIPDAQIAWRDVLAGGLATAVLFAAGKFAIGLYLGKSDPGSAFGAAGSLALMLLWIYYSAIILFLGAEFTQAWAHRHGQGIRPEPGAVRVVEHRERVRDHQRPEPRRTGSVEL